MKQLYNYILESQQYLYHYTNVGNAVNVCADDVFGCSEDDGYSPKGYPYYISTTRQRNALTGYPTGMISNKLVRFVLDGSKLSRFKITPIDWGHAKRTAIKSNWPAGPENFDKNIQSIMLQTNVESEDRILLKQEELKDFHKYISELHVDDSTATPNEIHLFKTYCDGYGIELKVMNHKSFMIGR